MIFASVATLGRNEYLTEDFFVPDYFDYVIIDEFHHAVSEQYQRIVKYFKPHFCWGLLLHLKEWMEKTFMKSVIIMYHMKFH